MPSATFTGRVEGYVFKMGAKGLGYYHDVPLTGAICTSPLHLSNHLQPMASSHLHVFRLSAWAESKRLPGVLA